MSMIVHRCRCGHIDQWHRHDNTSADNKCDGNLPTRACPCRQLRTGDPEIIPTWDAMGKPEALYKPGTKWNGKALCACPACFALYAQQEVPA